MKVIKGSWVEIENCILKSEERSSNLPEDTRNTDLTMWLRGFLMNASAEIGDEVIVKTLSGRAVSGKLCNTQPRHQYDYGDTIVELIEIGEELKEALKIAKQGGH